VYFYSRSSLSPFPKRSLSSSSFLFESSSMARTLCDADELLELPFPSLSCFLPFSLSRDYRRGSVSSPEGRSLNLFPETFRLLRYSTARTCLLSSYFLIPSFLNPSSFGKDLLAPFVTETSVLFRVMVIPPFAPAPVSWSGVSPVLHGLSPRSKV